MEHVRRYLDSIRHRWNLVDPVNPFYQVAGLTTSSGKRSGLTKIVADVPDNNRLFSTRSGPALHRMTLAEGARWIVHCQAFDTAGIKTGALGDPRTRQGKGDSLFYPAWTANIGVVLLQGANLFESLMLNLDFLGSGPADLPAWERPQLGPGVEEPEHLPLGPADLFTWQSRRILLFIESHQVVDVQISNGDRLTPHDRFTHEPMSSWKLNRQTTRNAQAVWSPVRHDAAKRIWQGIGPLLADSRTTQGTRRASSLEWLTQLYIEGEISRSYSVDLQIIGLEFDKNNSKITGAVDDRMTAPVPAISSPELIRVAIDAAQRARTGVVALANLAGNLDRAAGGEGKSRERTFELGYSLLDGPYRSWVRTLLDPEDAASYETAWDNTASGTLLRAGNGLLEDAGTAAILGRHVTQLSGESILLDAGLAQIWFRAALTKAFPYKNDEVKS